MPKRPKFTTTVESSIEDIAAFIPKHPFLFVVLHCDRPSLGGARFDLSELDLVTIGRGEQREASRTVEGGRRTLQLTLPAATISKEHARLVREADAWFLEDAGSRNGCFIRGTRITRARLAEGDFIELGNTFLRFRAALPVPNKASNNDLDSNALPSIKAMGFATLLPQLAQDLDVLAEVARLPLTTLLLGDTGTGKEVLAKGIHALSGRAGPFVGVNCGALTASLLESQLFGHVKGAFTGALRDELGFIRSADGGTLFLDEIGDLPLPAQVALLRVLEERELIPVGSTRPVAVDVRVVAATHKKLDSLCETGQFRLDLLARLSGHRHELAPLRDRIEELGVVLTQLLLGANAPDTQLTRTLGRWMIEYRWPMNIRELAQMLTTALALAKGATLNVQHFPAAISSPVSAPLAASERPALAEKPSPDELCGELVSLLQKHRGNVTKVAKVMGKTRAQIHRWMQHFGVDPTTYRDAMVPYSDPDPKRVKSPSES